MDIIRNIVLSNNPPEKHCGWLKPTEDHRFELYFWEANGWCLIGILQTKNIDFEYISEIKDITI